MARKATLYRARIELALVDRGVYDTLTLSVARHPSETAERMAARLLARALRHAPDLEFGRGVSNPEEPDLWRQAPDGRVLDWIEVGQPDARKLWQAGRIADRLAVFAFGAGCERWWESTRSEPRLPEELAVARLDDGLLEGWAAGFERQIRFSLTVSEGTLFLTDAEQSFESTPSVWRGEPF